MGLSLHEQEFIEEFDKEYYKELKFGFERGVRAVSDSLLKALIEARDIRFLRKLLKDKDKEVRWAAAWALGRIGEPAVEPLIEALKKDKEVRKAAAWALGEIGDARAVEPLIEALKKDKEVREAAAEALNSIASKSLDNLMAVRNALKYLDRSDQSE